MNPVGARRGLTALLLAVGTGADPLGAQPADTSAGRPEPLFARQDALAAGAFALGTVLMFPLDRELAASLQLPETQARRNVRRAVNEFNRIAFPGSLIIGVSLYAVGRFGDNNEMADLGLHGTEAIIVGLGLTSALKILAGRARPHVNLDDPRNFEFFRGWGDERYRSFPSGHSVAGFAAAAAVTSETARFWPRHTWYIAPMMFGGAALVGLSRMYDNKHWASDVVMGAAIGSFAGWKVVRYHHSNPDNPIDELLLGVTVTPGRGGALYRIWVFPISR